MMISIRYIELLRHIVTLPTVYIKATSYSSLQHIILVILYLDYVMVCAMSTLKPWYRSGIRKKKYGDRKWKALV